MANAGGGISLLRHLVWMMNHDDLADGASLVSSTTKRFLLDFSFNQTKKR